MLVLSASVNAESGQSGAAQSRIGQHTLDCKLDSELGLCLHEGAVLDLFHVADIAGVMIIHLLVELVAGEDSLLSVDDDYMIAAVGVRSECGLMLAAKKDGSLNCYLAERLTGSIDDIPLTGDVARFGHIS